MFCIPSAYTYILNFIVQGHRMLTFNSYFVLVLIRHASYLHSVKAFRGTTAD